MSCVTGKPVFGFPTRTDTIQAFNSTKEDGEMLEVWDLGSKGILPGRVSDSILRFLNEYTYS